MADNAKWYVAHTYSGYENAVKAAIEKSVVNRGMEDMVLKTEIPMETVTEVTETGVMKEVQRQAPRRPRPRLRRLPATPPCFCGY